MPSWLRTNPGSLLHSPSSTMAVLNSQSLSTLTTTQPTGLMASLKSSVGRLLNTAPWPSAVYSLLAPLPCPSLCLLTQSLRTDRCCLPVEIKVDGGTGKNITIPLDENDIDTQITPKDDKGILLD